MKMLRWWSSSLAQPGVEMDGFADKPPDGADYEALWSEITLGSTRATIERGRTLLTFSSENGSTAVVKYLLSRDNIDPRQKDTANKTPLWRAATNFNPEIVRLHYGFPHGGADRDRRRLDTVYSLLYNGNVEWVVTGSTFDHPDAPNMTVMLHHAVAFGVTSWVRLLLTRCEVNMDAIRRPDGTTLLAFASRGDIVRLLLARGANPNMKNILGMTPLSTAVQNRAPEAIPLLLEAGADPTMNDNNRLSPLYTAIQDNMDVIVEMLLDAVPQRLKSPNVLALPWDAAVRGDTQLLKNALSLGIDPGVRDPRLRTPLAIAAKCGHLSVVKLLIFQKTADVTSTDADGLTPLHHAVIRGHTPVVELLLADPRVHLVL
ncbi:ankyrin repeat-containing domain protein [Aspergillus crustosus]